MKKKFTAVQLEHNETRKNKKQLFFFFLERGCFFFFSLTLFTLLLQIFKTKQTPPRIFNLKEKEMRKEKRSLFLSAITAALGGRRFCIRS